MRITVRDCVICDRAFVTRTTIKVCGDQCRQERRRRERAVRKAYEKALTRIGSQAGSFTSSEWGARLVEYGRRCAYCRKQTELHVEHVMPLSRGGTNRIANVVPACSPCNRDKGTLTVDEWLRSGRTRVSSGVVSMELLPVGELASDLLPDPCATRRVA